MFKHSTESFEVTAPVVEGFGTTDQQTAQILTDSVNAFICDNSVNVNFLWNQKQKFYSLRCQPTLKDDELNDILDHGKYKRWRPERVLQQAHSGEIILRMTQIDSKFSLPPINMIPTIKTKEVSQMMADHLKTSLMTLRSCMWKMLRSTLTILNSNHIRQQ